VSGQIIIVAVHLGQVLPVKSLVLEALTMVAPRTLATCVTQVRRDVIFRFDFSLVDGEHTNIRLNIVST